MQSQNDLQAARVATKVAMKLTIVGAPEVGKSCLMKKITEENYYISPKALYKKTRGVDFALWRMNKKVNKKVNEKVDVQIWDIAGEERFGNMLHVYLKHTGAVVVCYDASAPWSFASVDRWIEKVKEHLPNVPVILLCLKSDLVADVNERAALATQLEAKAKEKGIGAFHMFSAKEDDAAEIQEVLSELLLPIIENKVEVAEKEAVDYVDPIKRIYNALYAVQTHHKRKNHWEENSLNTQAELNEAMDERAKLNHTTTAKAQELYGKYPNWEKDGEDKRKLIAEGSKWTSGLFNTVHLQLSTWSTFVFKKGADAHIEQKSLAQLEQKAQDKPHSRTAKFVNALKRQ